MQQDLRSLPISRNNPARRVTYRDDRHHVELRPTGVEDAEAIGAAVNASLPELRPFMPWAQGDTSVLFQLERLKRVHADYLTGRELGMGLFDVPSGAFLAGLGLHPRVPLNPRGLEVGYWTPSANAGKGFATLATKIAIAYAFELLECDRLQVSHDETNAASRRVVEKCGFRYEGTMRNMIGRPDPQIFAGGYRGTSRSRHYALVPDDRPSLDWYRGVVDALAAENLVGYPVEMHRPPS
jgi:ribosomal-protein-serine acetyltransferase